MKLRNRQRAMPNGVAFYDPATKYQAPQWSSFNQQVDGAINARLANPGVTKQYKLATDRPTVEAEVDNYLCSVAMRQGWSDFVDHARQVADEGLPADQARPFYNPGQPTRQPFGIRAQNVVAGGEVIVEWLSSGAEAVPMKLAESRAETCAKCPLNGRGGLEQIFTLPVAAAIRAALNTRREMRLETKFDDQLGVCEACLCPLKLKVHLPISRIWSGMSDDAKAALDPGCWIPKEASQTSTQ